MPRHKHADCIIAWAEGKEIQVRHAGDNGRWRDMNSPYTPNWSLECEYRIKPVKHTGWMCLYRIKATGVVCGGKMYASMESANINTSMQDRIAIIPIEFEETL